VTWSEAPHFDCGRLSVLLLLDPWPLWLEVVGNGFARTLERVSGMCNHGVCGQQVLTVLDPCLYAVFDGVCQLRSGQGGCLKHSDSSGCSSLHCLCGRLCLVHEPMLNA